MRLERIKFHLKFRDHLESKVGIAEFLPDP